MYSPIVFEVLLVLSGLGLILGASYYFRPEKIVYRRIKSQHWETAKKDPEFRKWLDTEIRVQIKRTQRMGMIMVILEAIWLVLVFGLWMKTRGH